MTLSPILAQGLSPHRVPIHFQRPTAQALREYIERLRLSSFRSGRPASIVLINATRGRLFLDEAIRYRELLQRLDANWAHENAVDWLDMNHIGIVLPDTHAIDAFEFIERICTESRIPTNSIRVYARDVFKPKEQFRSLDELYSIPIPKWKRTIDIIGSLCLLVMAFPILVMACLLVRLTSKGPVLFAQWRVGRGGRPFCILKFRTMHQDADQQKSRLRNVNEQDGLGFKISKDPRVTDVGQWLRKTSIDELPQLINVLKGEMSLVGPRPLPCSDWNPEETWICRRHDVTPGLTCIWQISGRSQVKFDEWMQMDLEYVDSMSLSEDLRLIARTLPAVISQDGAT